MDNPLAKKEKDTEVKVDNELDIDKDPQEEAEESNHDEDVPSSGRDLSITSDDEKILENDRKIFEDQKRGIIQQADGVLAWEIKGLYTDKGKIKNKFLMLQSPPYLVVKDSEGNVVNVILTKEFSDELSDKFNAVSKAYRGVNVEKKDEENKTLKERMTSLVKWIKIHPFKTSIVVIIVAFFVWAQFFA